MMVSGFPVRKHGNPAAREIDGISRLKYMGPVRPRWVLKTWSNWSYKPHFFGGI